MRGVHRAGGRRSRRKSCLTKVGAVAGKRIVTIEGLAPEGKLHPVQEAFLEADAMQCGWCTPGMILGAVALLRRTPHPTEAEIVSGMNGHICRCGTYPRVVARDSRGGEERRPGMRRRDFFAVLGGGIVVLLVDDDSDAQESGGGGAARRSEPMPAGGRAPGCTSAKTGVVTVYTGKVEVGQNARTSLTQAVAEELHAPVASIRMVMGDTELTPFDMGTFGSHDHAAHVAADPQARPRRRARCCWTWRRRSGGWSARRITVADGKVTAGSRSRRLRRTDARARS